ncbi:aldehyde dehydrogenase family protein [Roseobacter sp. HKCCD9010]|uniref:aldehyde dehydrogenase family protein n=1 Tax=unclassified Roseobacter TaxID=196798 RepID=UPI0014924E74|nr:MULTISPECIES: aldehyde dehydrogenase family protein [unclassified Roseobacter]MBF9048990.1 aldehyde dehydrogenase family protein [Rhodobacterales bacterium HKCCD4356]NNV10989.1 aldehyde dehydrogenase family protein [Roseobacter sp. HKCCD7357]NNV15174.1 aldehyde dehydrogenase family protein [Roseobacter sp. HKCCD8768]NNV24633.1 aldehyde dehydrogenase family protein [Roseobacter sp. HKCCD8192]NNV28890.1 aldehyde dehydrogenase family protein [Roseobacter sp. HKCCD9061]
MSTREIFDSMDYGPAPEGDAEARDWIADKGPAFGHFIDGAFTEPGETFASNNPANGETLAEISQGSAADVDMAVAAARRAFPKWAKLTRHQRARHLYALARLLQKHSRLFAVLETMDNGKPIRESRDIDIPLAQRHFYYHAGLAQLLEDEMPGHAPLGVCGQVIPWNFPLLMLSWKIAPALAAGNTVVLKPAEYTSLTALLFADICREAGLPKGVVNIVTGDGRTGEAITTHPDINKVAFTGSTEVGRRIRQATAGSGKSLTLELGGKSPYIVFDDADIDSAIEGLVDAIWFNQGQVCCAGSRLLVQEGIAEDFHARLKARMDKLRIGDPLDKCIDVGAVVDPVQHATITRLVDENTEGQTYRAAVPLPETGCFYPPTLITGLSTAAPLMQEEIFGPVLVSTTFRTPAEAVQIANNTRYGLAATLWTENLNLALDIGPKLAAGVVWVNATNLFDAAAPFGGVRESGFGREGGWEGLLAYLKPIVKTKALTAKAPIPAPDAPDAPGLDRTAKMYIGGKQTRPDGGYSEPVWSAKGKLLGHMGLGNRKDIRNAVEAAQGAAGWSKTTGHLRAQILYYIGENLSARADEFASRIRDLTGVTAKQAEAEVETAIDRLFTYAAWADKFDGTAKSVPIRGVALAMTEPVGVIGALAPDDAPLLGAISLIAPAIAMGNRIVLVPSYAAPLAATDLYQVLDTSDVPAGVVNIVTGDPAELTKPLAGHMNLDAIWAFTAHAGADVVETASASNLKRTWVHDGQGIDWMSKAGEGKRFLQAATEVKTIWVPYGE